LSDAEGLSPLVVERLVVKNFRNLERVELEPGPRFNVLSGDNAQGKTNLLEALYVGLTSKSFRVSRPRDLIRQGAEASSVRVVLRDGPMAREQRIGLTSRGRVAYLDETRVRALAEYAVRSPVVLFHPGSLVLSTGGGMERRKLLDRLAMYGSPVSFVDLRGYTRALRMRQRVLESRGPLARDLEGWEELVVRHGLALVGWRLDALEHLAGEAVRAFGRVAPSRASLELGYERTTPGDMATYRAELVQRREADIRRGGASVGPHRDDMRVVLDGGAGRLMASQGQHRAVVLALKLGELAVLARSRRVWPLLLLDDVSSELDAARTEALFAHLRDERGQVFLTTTRRELIELPADLSVRVYFRVVSGGIERD
jgi:DNA replication and repair protein RecF